MIMEALKNTLFYVLLHALQDEQLPACLDIFGNQIDFLIILPNPLCDVMYR